jgi:hypothetical protein
MMTNDSDDNTELKRLSVQLRFSAQLRDLSAGVGAVVAELYGEDAHFCLLVTSGNFRGLTGNFPPDEALGVLRRMLEIYEQQPPFQPPLNS